MAVIQEYIKISKSYLREVAALGCASFTGRSINNIVQYYAAQRNHSYT